MSSPRAVGAGRRGEAHHYSARRRSRKKRSPTAQGTFVQREEDEEEPE